MTVSNIVVSGLQPINEFGHVSLSWSVNDPGVSAGTPTLLLDQVEIWAAAVNDRSQATKIVEARNAAIHASVVEGATYFYWARARDLSANFGDWYPLDANDGTRCRVVYANSAAQDLANVLIIRSVNANALTIALKTLSGDDPSPLNPVVASFRNSAFYGGAVAYRQITAPLSLVISNGSTMGAVNATPFRLWLELIDDAGTLRLAAKNCSNALAIYPLSEYGTISTTAEGGAGGADNIGVAYSGVAVTNKPFRILGFVEWSAGLAAAGVYDVAPDGVQIFGPGVKKPGDIVQTALSRSAAVASGTTILPYDDTIPQNNEGTQFFSTDITPTSTVNILRNEYVLRCSAPTSGASSPRVAAALFQDNIVNALSAVWQWDLTGGETPLNLSAEYQQLALTTVQTTFKVRLGKDIAGTMTLNGITGNRAYGGVLWSQHKITELMG